MNLTSVQLLKPDDDDDDDDDAGVVRWLRMSRQRAVSSVIIAEHGNARGVIQFNVVRVFFFVSHIIF